MADKRLQDFPLRGDADDNDLILVSSQSEAFKMKFSVLRAYVSDIAREAVNQVNALGAALSDHVADNLNSAVEQQRSIHSLETRLAALEESLTARTEQMSREYQEGDETLEAKIQNLRDRISSLSVRVEQLGIDLGAADTAMGEEFRREDNLLNTKLLSLQSSVGALERRISEGQSALERTDREILAESREGDADLDRRIGVSLSALEDRILTLESRMDTLRITTES